MDAVYYAIAKEAEKNPFIGILFGGTLSHFLYTIVLVSLHLPHDDMTGLWEEAQKLYEKGMENMLQYLHQTLFAKVEH